MTDQPRTPAELLRWVAACRGDYIRPGMPAHMAETLADECRILELAALVVEGDLSPLYSWLPSWHWTDEMNAALYGREVAAQTAGTSEQP